MTQPIEPRPVVAWFAQHMERQLCENDHKSGWLGDSPNALMVRCAEELFELSRLLSPELAGVVPMRIFSEAADVANFAMMIADLYGPSIGPIRADVANFSMMIADLHGPSIGPIRADVPDDRARIAEDVPDVHPEFQSLLTRMACIFAAKNHDYARGEDPLSNLMGSQDFGVEPWRGTMIRANDKWERVKALVTKGSAAVEDETLEDTLIDMANYNLLIVMLLRRFRPVTP